ncbi:pentatricopeptide repeat-containing protein [Quercus suber]|uniref:Pentatricopeptide repeat-containing protein n=1 Tax=Quercus suber TaxID=58331 RepID=A0AAW0JUI1_QUESU
MIIEGLETMERWILEEAFDVFDRLRGVGVCPSIATWNSALLGCLKVGRTDLVWKLYKEMVQSSVVAKVDVETVGYLIRVFCEDKKVSKGYELLRQVLEDGLDPGNAAFNDLISGFLRSGNIVKYLNYFTQ